MEVLEGQNILVTISGKKNRVRVYYLSWLKSKILRTDGLSDVSFARNFNLFRESWMFNLQQVERRNGWINVGDLQGAVHFKIVKYERIKFLVIALKDSIEIYAWAPKPYHKFMAFKVRLAIVDWCVKLTCFPSAEFRWIESSPVVSRFDSRRADALESYLRIRRWLPRCWLGLSDCLWYLSAKTCKIFGNFVDNFLIHFDFRLKDQSLHTASSHCPTRMAWISCCAMTTKAFMSTQWDVCRRTLCCNGARCRHRSHTSAQVRSWDGAIKRLRWVKWS